MSYLDDPALLAAVDAGASLRQLEAAGHGSRSALSRRIRRAKAAREERLRRHAEYNARRPSRTQRPALLPTGDPDATAERRPELADTEAPLLPPPSAAGPPIGFCEAAGSEPIIVASRSAQGREVTLVNALAIHRAMEFTLNFDRSRHSSWIDAQVAALAHYGYLLVRKGEPQMIWKHGALCIALLDGWGEADLPRLMKATRFDAEQAGIWGMPYSRPYAVGAEHPKRRDYLISSAEITDGSTSGFGELVATALRASIGDRDVQ